MDKGESAVGIHIYHDSHMTYAATGITSGKEHQVARLQVATVHGMVAGILVA
jgi:hypothetical protein